MAILLINVCYKVSPPNVLMKNFIKLMLQLEFAFCLVYLCSFSGRFDFIENKNQSVEKRFLKINRTIKALRNKLLIVI